MATSMAGPYDIWLTETLKSASADIDTDVFVEYIIGILDDETEEEKDESITELLSGVIDPDLASELCKKISDKWKEQKEAAAKVEKTEDRGDQLSDFLGKQTLATVKEKKLTKEEADRKAAILAQYSQISDEDDDDDDDLPVEEVHAPPPAGGGGGASSGKPKVDTSDLLLVKNVNKDEVNKAQQEMREKAKAESEKKKEKDKQDRQAQKQKQQERKENEKKRTQKGEKRR